MESQRNLERILLFALVVTLALFGFRKVYDTDTWVHLTLGRLIVRTGGLPRTETLVYTALGRPFLYLSAVYGVTLYWLNTLLGPLGLVLVKTTAIVLCYLTAYRDSLRGNRHAVAAALIVTVVALFSQQRFTDRPEVVANVFLAFTMFAVATYLETGSRLIWWLPVTTLLWANVHSSVVLVVVPFAAAFGATVFERGLEKVGGRFRVRPSWHRLARLSVVFLCSLAAGLVNPYFYSQFLLGKDALGTSVYKDEITELQRSTWQNARPALILIGLLVLVPLVHWILARRARRKQQEAWDPSLMGYLAAAFAVILTLDAVRFQTILGLLAIPPLAQSVGAILDQIPPKLRVAKRGLVYGCAAGVIILAGVCSAFGVRWLPKGASPVGFGYDYSSAPKGALDYLDHNGVAGRVFNTFHFGGFLLWESDGKRTVFVDPRGSIDLELFEKSLLAPSRPYIMDELHRRFQFESLVLQYPLLPSGVSGWMDRDAAFSHPDWALVYWDDVALVYLRRSGPYASLVARDEYHHLKPANGPDFVERAKQNPFLFQGVVQDIRRAAAATDSSYARLLLGTALLADGQTDTAINELQRASEGISKGRRSALLYKLGLALFQRGDFRQALGQFESIPAGEVTPGVDFWAGTTHLKLGEDRRAASRLEKAIAQSPEILAGYEQLEVAYSRLGEKSNFERVRSLRARQASLNTASLHFETGLTAYDRGDLQTAASEFQLSLQVNPASATVESNLGFVLLDLGKPDESAFHQKRALALDPSLANAYYGLALAAKMLGDTATARAGWENYLRLEPKGHFSRRARQELGR